MVDVNELKALDNIFAEDLEKSRNDEKDVIKGGPESTGRVVY